MSVRRFLRNRVQEPRTKAALKSLSIKLGYNWSSWSRTVAYETCKARLEEIGPEQLDTLEISPGTYWRQIPFRSYTEVSYPDFDVCSDTLDQQFDLIICDQVFEHLLWPARAARNVQAMLRPGGLFLNVTPFMLRIHDGPHDCTRWTEEGMKYFLADNGFDLDAIETGAWGNRKCIKANFRKWPSRGFFASWFSPLHNEPKFPIMIWAFARKGQNKDTRGDADD